MTITETEMKGSAGAGGGGGVFLSEKARKDMFI